MGLHELPAAASFGWHAAHHGCREAAPSAPDGGMSKALDRMREELIKARILRHIVIRRQSDMAEAEPERPLPDVPLHQRGFGVMDEPLA
jgi:hypothetical protein